MREYLIRADEDEGWIAVHVNDLARMLTPHGWGAVAMEGWGDHRLRLGGTELSFSGEAPGWHVAFEGEISPETADAAIETIARQLAEHAGRSVSWFKL
ncbi:hypothetical protein GCM10010191_42460 [Actinomadura vinacea]|uniref:Uncharacterized protein n=1 Tax=Actinomadura vinacea TaxID=115336 RepID=A0ABN3JA96_9ACTN